MRRFRQIPIIVKRSWSAPTAHAGLVAGLCRNFSSSTTTEVKSNVMFGPYGSGGTVSGFTAPGFESIREAFESGFAINQELGAQVVMYRGEDKVVDLFGSNSKQPGYTGDTLQCVYSSGKNMESIIVAMLVDRGLLCYDERVATYWPEFAQNSKENITIADVMRHEGGIPIICASSSGVDGSLTVVSETDVQDPDAMAKIIQAAFLWRDEDHPRVYHAVSRGWIVSGIVRRVDPQKRTLGQFMHEEISKPLGLTYFCGLPEAEQPKYNFANMTQMSMPYNLTFEVIPAALGVGCPYLGAAMAMLKDKSNPILKPVCSWLGNPATPAFNNTPLGRAVEIPSAGMHCNARSMAKVNACMANGGGVDGVRIMSEKACADALSGVKVETDQALKLTSGFTQAGVVEFVSVDGKIIDPSCRIPGWYGWGGWGGSISMWHPEKKLGFSYTMNAMSNYLFGGPKFKPMADALQKLE